jgi:hypothetical protein
VQEVVGFACAVQRKVLDLHLAYAKLVPPRFPGKHRVAVCGKNLNCVELLSMLLLS